MMALQLGNHSVSTQPKNALKASKTFPAIGKSLIFSPFWLQLKLKEDFREKYESEIKGKKVKLKDKCRVITDNKLSAARQVPTTVPATPYLNM